ncbi:hypothetical protein FNH22_30005 [Fulvivirga sp. M361]|uniref:hypothetical protein n=1 Tax=Fulvivirga sp. M361 TaxID=2594266 RepID=UPI00117A6B26|nr:hypothetical protein [Fulvivirga sp. M361]TRX47309.1 hypothetical protein FNH22_30005 [Fulvivirga sp. M361]
MKYSRLMLPMIALALSSCVYSLFPFYSEETIVYHPEINGKWLSEDSSVMILEPFYGQDDISNDLNISSLKDTPDVNQKAPDSASPKGYKMTFKDDDATLVYLVYLFRVKESTYMDLYPWLEKGVHQIQGEVILIDNLFPVHSVMQIRLEANSLTLKQFNLDKLNKLFKSNRIRLRHEIVNDEVLITAKTPETQKFLENYSKDPSVYGHEEVYIRML